MGSFGRVSILVDTRSGKRVLGDRRPGVPAPPRKFVATDTLKCAVAPDPSGVQGRWPWLVACCMLRVAEHQVCFFLKYGLLFKGCELTQRGPTQESLHEVSTDT